jgi:HAD superfamily hydrolase (TIGR01459 family)
MGPSPRFVAGLSQLEGKDVLFCDVWGVIHNGVAHDPAACAALTRFRQGGGTVVLVSNAPRPNSDIFPQFQRLGVPDSAFDAIVTSGDVTRTLIAARAGQPVYFIGPDRDLTLFEGLDAPHAAVGEAAYCVCTGLEDDETESAADYADRLREMAVRGLMMICANPDLVVERGTRLVPCGGAIGAAYEDIGGRVVYPGKPWRPIYETAMAIAVEQRGAPVTLSRCLAIGDAIRTDVAGAVQFGIDVLMVLSGIHGGAVLEAGRPVDETRVRTWIKSQDFRPGFVIRSLSW